MIKSKGSIVGKVGSFRWTTIRETDGVTTEDLIFSSTGTFGRSEVISYDDTPRKGPIKTTRFCHHVVREEFDKVVNFEGYFDNALHFCHPGYVGFPTFSEPAIPTLTNFHAEAMNFFKSGCTDTKVSLLASLAEIGELKSLGPQLLSAFKQLAQRSVNYTWRSLKKDLKAGANIHLSYSFGIKPLLSDIKGVYKSLSSLEDRIRYLRKNNGKPLRVQFTRTLPSTDSRRVVVNDLAYQVIEELSSSGNYVAFATVTYDVSQLSNWELRLRILKRQLGLTDLASTAWELIPFSFLIDWFLNIGNLISQIPDFITIPMTIGDCGWYVKMEHRSRTTLRAMRPAGNSYFPGNWRTTRVFHREPGFPRTFASLVADGDLSLQQLGLGISLSLQKWR